MDVWMYGCVDVWRSGGASKSPDLDSNKITPLARHIIRQGEPSQRAEIAMPSSVHPEMLFGHSPTGVREKHISREPLPCNASAGSARQPLILVLAKPPKSRVLIRRPHIPGKSHMCLGISLRRIQSLTMSSPPKSRSELVDWP